MKKRLMLALMLILCAMLLASCGESKKYDVLTSQNSGNQQTQQNMGTQTGKNPPAEEPEDAVDWTEADLPDQPVATSTPAPTVRSEYAVATPVVIDPIDKPTPTAVPKLTVAYTTYDATKLGLSFEGPAGWEKDDSAATVFIIRNPNPRMDYKATLTLQTTKISGEYSEAELKTIVNGMLDSIESEPLVVKFSPSQTDGRTLLGKNGIYANYTAELLVDGEEVQAAGRVHAVCVGKALYTIHLTAPRAQWEDYKDLVYNKLRDTLSITK